MIIQKPTILFAIALLAFSAIAQPRTGEHLDTLRQDIGPLTDSLPATIRKAKANVFVELAGGNVWFKYGAMLPYRSNVPKFGYSITGGAAVTFLSNLRARFGLSFLQTGSRLNVSDNSQPPVVITGYNNETDYFISAPIDIDFFILPTPITISLGIETAYLCLADYNAQIYLNDQARSPYHENRTIYDNPINIILNVGTGLRFNLFHRIHSEIKVLYSMGFFPINKSGYSTSSNLTREISLRYLWII